MSKGLIISTPINKNHLFDLFSKIANKYRSEQFKSLEFKKLNLIDPDEKPFIIHKHEKDYPTLKELISKRE